MSRSHSVATQPSLSAVHIPNSWIFSIRQDFALALLSLGFGAFCAVYFYHFVPKYIALLGYSLMAISFDAAHIIASHGRTYLDKKIFNSHRSMHIWGAVATTLVCIGLSFFIGRDLFLCIVAVPSLFHYCRQHYGWMMIANSKGRRMSEGEAYFQRAVLTALCFLPALVIAANPAIHTTWFTREVSFGVDFFFIPFQILLWITLALFVGGEIREWIRYKHLNISKWLQVSLLLVVWYILPTLIEYKRSVYFAVATHGITAWYLNYKYMNHEWPKQKYFGHKLFQSRFRLLYFFLFTAFCSLLFLNFSFMSDRWVQYMGFGYQVHITLFSLGISFALLHYFFEAHLWKISGEVRFLEKIK